MSIVGTRSGRIANPLDKAAGIGQANLDALGVSANAPADWRPIDKEMRCTALFGNPVAVEGDPYGEERAAWDGIEAPFGTL